MRNAPYHAQPNPHSLAPYKAAEEPPRLTLDHTVKQMTDRLELRSTILSLLVSGICSVLQIVTATWFFRNAYGEHQLYFLYIVLGKMVNAIFLLQYVGKSKAGDDPWPGGATSTEPELAGRMRESPVSAGFFFILGLFELEALCFVTPNLAHQSKFRKLSFLSALVQDLPLMITLGSFLINTYAWAELLLLLTWIATILEVALKLTRTIVLGCMGDCEEEGKVPMFRNLRLEDVVLLPLYLLHFALAYFLVLWMFQTASHSHQGQEWMEQQFLSLTGFNNEIVLDQVLDYQDYGSGSNYTALAELAGAALNKTIEAETLTVLDVITGLLMPDGWVDDSVRSAADTYLNASAIPFVEEWHVIHRRAVLSTVVGTVFYASHWFVSLGLAFAYFRLPSYKESFQTNQVARSSMVSAAVILLSIATSNTLACFTQDKRGYAIVKRDAAISSIIFLGAPFLAIAAIAVNTLNCQNRACEGLTAMGGVEWTTWPTLALVTSAPLIWWQVLTLLASVVALRSSQSTTTKTSDSSNRHSQDAIDDMEPPVPAEEGCVGHLALAIGLLFSCAVWVLEFVYLVALAWNSPIALRTIGGKPAHEWGSDYLGDSRLSAEIDFGSANPTHEYQWDEFGNMTRVLIDPPLPWRPRLVDNFFYSNLWTFVIGVITNILVIVSYMAYSATRSLRQAVEERISLTALAFSLTAVTPEAMRLIATNRRDVMRVRKLNFLPALLVDAPIVGTATYIMVEYEVTNFLFLVACAAAAHMFLSLYRAGVVGLTEQLRRPPTPYADRPSNISFGDGALLFFGTLHFAIMWALLCLYQQAQHHGGRLGLSEDHVGWVRFACYAQTAILLFYMCSSLFTALSFLNHWVYASSDISERSYRSTFALMLATMDPCWLNLLSEDAIHVTEVSRVGLFVSAIALYAPSLCIQVIIVFMVNLDWEDYKLHVGEAPVEGSLSIGLVDPDLVQNLAIAATVLIGVAKLLRLVYIHQTLARERLERERVQREEERHHRALNPHARHPPASASSAKLEPVFKHAMPWSDQWEKNRLPPTDWVDPRQAAAAAQQQQALYGVTVTGAAHVMGYAVNPEDGSYMLDADGNYMMADGVTYMVDANGEYVVDEEGEYVLDGIVSHAPTEGDANAYAADVTDTSRSTNDTYGAEQGDYNAYGFEGGGGPAASPAAMLEAKCPQKAIFRTPDGYDGVFIVMPEAGEYNPSGVPYLFIQSHEVKSIKKKGWGGPAGAAGAQVSFTFMSIDAGGLDRDYVEQNVYEFPDVAWQTLQASDVDSGLAVDGEAGYDQAASGFYPADAALPAPAPLPPFGAPVAVEDAPQRL